MKICSFLKKFLYVLFGLDVFSETQNWVHYIKSGVALPDKLDAFEEGELTQRVSLGDIDARSKLIEHNLRLVVYTAQKFENSGVLLDDLISIGTVGLIKAVSSFDVNKNIKMATFASRCIENEILMHLRKSVKIKREVSLDNPINVDSDGNELLLADIMTNDEDLVFKPIETETDNNLLNSALKGLKPREKLIISMRFGLVGSGDEMTQKEVADFLNISQSYISRLEKKILGRLKKDIELKL